MNSIINKHCWVTTVEKTPRITAYIAVNFSRGVSAIKEQKKSLCKRCKGLNKNAVGEGIESAAADS
jgi:argininosuccinate synthase